MPTKTKPKAGPKAKAVATKAKGTKAKPAKASTPPPAPAQPETPAGLFRDRIIGEGTEAPDQILANPLNWRRHPKHQADALEGLLKTVGWVQRVIINRRTGHLVDGHLRVELAMRREEPAVPVLYVDLSEAEEKLVLAAIDPIGGLADTDQTMLDDLLKGIKTGDTALDALLDDLRSDGAQEVEETGNTGDDDIPPAQLDAVSRAGEVWILGEHRLLVGDSTRQADVEKVMAGERADMVWTDPPYNVAYEDSSGRTIQNDSMSGEKFLQFLTDAFGCAFEVTKAGCPIYIAHADSEGLNFRAAMKAAGWDQKQTLVWVKDGFTLGRQDYQWQHEPILYGWKPGEAHRWYGERDKSTVEDDEQPDLKQLGKPELIALVNQYRNAQGSTVIRLAKPKRSELHPTMKPVSLVKLHLKNSSRRGDVVFEPFGGSGTTLIACQAIGRRARVLELDPIYADVIIRRWQGWTGDQALRESDGRPFDELAGV
jgi:DNA modification methylase